MITFENLKKNHSNQRENNVFSLVRSCSKTCVFAVLALTASIANAGGYSFSNGYYWSGGVPYLRYVVPSCYSHTGYVYQYKQAYVAKPVGSTYNNTTYNYSINYAQPTTAPQANTLYGVPSTALSLSSYGNVDLGATVDGLLRLSSDMQVGAKGVASDVSSLVGDVAALTASQNQAVAAVAEIQAKAELLRAAQPSPQLALSLQSGGTAQGQKLAITSATWGSLTEQHCGACHGPNGSNRTAFDLTQLGTVDGYKSAISRILTDDPELRMPKGRHLDAAAIVALLKEMGN